MDYTAPTALLKDIQASFKQLDSEADTVASDIDAKMDRILEKLKQFCPLNPHVMS